MEVYRDFGVHNIFASSLVLEHTAGDERFARDILYEAGKHYPRPMKCVLCDVRSVKRTVD